MSGSTRLLQRFLKLLEADRAVQFAVAVRVWQLLAGFVSVLMIAHFLSGETQGYYYTFASLAALQSSFELGLYIVVTNVSSHEWAKLKIDEHGGIAGDSDALSRLASLGRLIFRWYGVASMLFVAAVGAGGYVFLSRQAESAVAWKEPWAVFVVLTGLLLWTLPFNALLEGCNQVATVNRYRLIQAICANLAVWTVIATGAGLWALVAATAARLVCDLYLLLVRYGRFFRPFWSTPEGDRIRWSQEVWPMQWRIGLGAVFAYFEFSLFTPVMFSYHGEVVAGQMGMTWVLLTGLQASALAWVQTRVPRFGMLVAERKYDELDRLYRRLMLLSLGVVMAGGAVLTGFVVAINALELSLANRVLSPLTVAVFVTAIVVYQTPHCQVYYLRAHKREPLLVVNIIASLAIGLAVWLLGSRFGPLGSACGYLAVVTLFVLPSHTYLWLRCRREWHD